MKKNKKNKNIYNSKKITKKKYKKPLKTKKKIIKINNKKI
jgi:hypothetical protein